MRLINSTLNSYGQIFFSKSKALAILVILSSFVNWHIGLWGLLAVLTTNLLAHVLGFSKEQIHDGLFGLNSLLVGMGLAAQYQVNMPFVIVFFSACLLTLLITVALLGYLSQLGVPFLSLPFLFSYWIMQLAVRQYGALELNISDIYMLNYLYGIGGMPLVQYYEWLNNLELPNILLSYFNSLAAILFHNNIITGILITIALIISSRIAFSLSLVGYLSGYGFYYFVGGDFNQLYHSHIGFNFILTAIAIGGFFFIPSWRTYLLVLVITPLIAMLIAAFTSMLLPFALPVLSLPFAIVVIMMIYVMNFAVQGHFVKVTHQNYAPEKNLYAYKNYLERFAGTTYFQLSLPFFGEWKISQGFDGKYTHKGDWKYAWDFVVEDEEGKTFKDNGNLIEDYYCFNLPITAPSAGYIVDILDNIADNEVGGVDLKNNWGNSIVIKHAEFLYTKISHIKANSFKVKIGDYVQKGDVIAALGNSGRSPEPHIHFQVQASPYIGSKTMKYPLAYYMKKNTDGGVDFNMSGYPEEGDTVFNVKTTSILQDAFHFIPGKSLRFDVENLVTGKRKLVEWEIYTNALGQPYIYCAETQSSAYFANDGTMHYFTSFQGNRNSILYYFYLGTYRILLGFYKDLKINDIVPLHEVDKGFGLLVQDFFAPFFIYRKVNYQAHYLQADNTINPKEIKLQTYLNKIVFGRKTEAFCFNIEIKNEKIENFQVEFRGEKLVARQVYTIEN